MTERVEIDGGVTLYTGDVLAVLPQLPSESVHSCVTSPPYWGLRDYRVAGQLGLEKTPVEYVEKMVAVFCEVRRVLRDDGTLWLNIGDSYAANRGYQVPDSKWQDVGNSKGMKADNFGLKPKDLIGIPWLLAFALRADGWYLRQDIIWHKPNPMPESVTDRCTKAHEYIFLLSKSERYYYDAGAIKEPGLSSSLTTEEYAFARQRTSNQWYQRVSGGPPGEAKSNNNLIGGRCPPGGRNKRSVWTMTPKPYKGAHFATFPPELPETCIKAGTSEKGCCPVCSAPWRRITEKCRTATRPGGDTKTEGVTVEVMGNRDPERHVTESVTVGWKASCEHDDEPVPCTVLDPFFGAGTTGIAAISLKRRCIGIELSPDYVAQATERLSPGPLMRAGQNRKGEAR